MNMALSTTGLSVKPMVPDLSEREHWRISLSIAELSTSQVDVLWHCLVCDSDRSDDTLEWFLQQAQSKEFHALDASALQYIFAEKVAYFQRLLLVYVQLK